MPDNNDEEFDRIVERLDLELPFPAESTESEETERRRHPSEQPIHPSQRDPEPSTGKERSPDEFDDVAYRTPPARPRRPPSRARMAAWTAVLGGPALMVLATLSGFILPRPVVLAASLIFVAAVIYLISQLPEHGPSRPDWPDDGAVL